MILLPTMNTAALFTVVVGIGIAAFGVYAVAKSGRQAVTARAARTWPAATATIDSTTMNERAGRGRLGRARRYYSLSVTYHYPVGGVSYAGDVINPMYAGSTNQADTLDLLAKLPQGAAVQVRYNPAKPQQSTLTTGYLASGASGLLLGGFILVFGLLSICMGLLQLSAGATELASRIVPG